MKKLFGSAGLVLLLAAGLAATAWAADPQNAVPVAGAGTEYLCTFGPNAWTDNGKEDNSQELFCQVPADAGGKITFYIFDPYSGSRYEQRSGWGDVETEFSLYGGKGAYSDPAVKTVEPLDKQPGTQLLTKVYGKGDEKVAGKWVELGTVDVSQGEVIGGTSYFRLVAYGKGGRSVNFFRAACSSRSAVWFAYEVSMHLPEPDDSVITLPVELPVGVDTVQEHSYDLDRGGQPYVNGKETTPSLSGQWAVNTVRLADTQIKDRVTYEIHKGQQTYANCTFYFTDTKGNLLRIYFAGAPVAENECHFTTSLVRMDKRIATSATLNEPVTYTIAITAQTDVRNVIVKDTPPAGTKMVKQDPAATKAGEQLSWNLGELRAGEVRQVSVTVEPQKEGVLTTCSTVTAEPFTCESTIVGKPVLEIAKTGPAVASLNSDVSYRIVVRNTGNALAKNVVVTDAVPAGMQHASGQASVTIPVGDLAPGQSRELPVVFKAVKRGKVCNTAAFTSDNAGKGQAEACTEIVQQILEIAKTTEVKEQFCGKNADYQIVVNNPGDTVLKNVTVTDRAPEGTKIMAAPGATITGQNAVWTIPELKAGEKKTFSVTLTSRLAGNLCNVATVTSAEGLSASSQACTVWKGHPALLIEVVDTNDPLLPGEKTTYIIRVTNQGTADDTNVTMAVTFPPEMVVESAEGATAGTVKDGAVTFAPVATITPKQVVEWKINAKAGGKATDVRVKASMNSTLLKNPVHEEESTHIY